MVEEYYITKKDIEQLFREKRDYGSACLKMRCPRCNETLMFELLDRPNKRAREEFRRLLRE